MHLSSYSKQTGVALITVLFIFALVSMLAISMQERQSMDIAQASVTFNQTKARLILLSAEDIAKSGLKFDLDRDTKNNELWDTSSELWNVTQIPVKLDAQEVGALNDVFVIIQIRDLQGLFNLNWLAPNAPNSATAQDRFQRMLTNLGVANASQIAIGLHNWFLQGSSANYVYQNMEPPYLAFEGEMSHPSELKLIDGMTDDVYNLIEPYVTALPSISMLNINTTLTEVLNAWDGALDRSQVEKMVAKARSNNCETDRSVNLYKDTAEFMAENEIVRLSDKTKFPNNQWSAADFRVNTEYFSVLIQVAYEDTVMVSESIIRRKSNTASGGANNGFMGVVYRDFSRKAEDMGPTGLNKVSCSL